MKLDTGYKPTLKYPSMSTQTMSVEDCFGKLFSMRDEVHLLHLNSKSFAEHVALNDYYEALLDNIDTLIETKQSDGLANITIPQTKISCDSITCVSGFRDYLESIRILFPSSYQQQILDNFAEITNKTLYKLKFLK